MATVRIKGVSSYRDRHGRTRYRFRAKGLKPVSLPGSPGDPAFLDALKQAQTQAISAGASRTIPGSLNAAVTALLTANEWRRLRPATQTTLRPFLEWLRRGYGNRPLAELRPPKVRQLLDEISEKPNQQTKLLKALRMLAALAVSRGFISQDFTLGVKRPKVHSAGYTDWSDDDIAQFETAHGAGSRARLALYLLLFTAQRRADVVRLGRQHCRGGFLAITQSKTGTHLEIPVLPPLQHELDRVPQGQLTFIQTDRGAPFSPAGFGNWFRAQANAAGLKSRSAHGLRKSAARRLAEAGATAHEIMAITGHQSLSEVTRYTRAASQKRLAEKAAPGLVRETKA